MDQLKRRFYILGLSLLVLIVALAGLLGVLDSLPQPESSVNTPPKDVQPAASPPPGNDEKPRETTTPPSANETPRDSGITPGFTLSLPDSFDLGRFATTNPGLSLESSMPVHLPILEVSGAENTEYLKSITASYFDGVEWVQEELGDYIEYNGELVIPPGIVPDRIAVDYITVSTLVDIANGKVAIPTSLYPASVNSSEPLLYFPDDMTFLAEEEFPEVYMFETIHFIFERQALATADLDLIEEYLQLPENITPRTYELAESITGGIESCFLMAKALEDYLKTNYTYDFESEPAPAGWEPNDWFLFEEKSGVCTNFNSAFVVLCRAAGIPARLVGGFHIDPREEAQVVYTDQAHAWAEVKFKELGWYTFDATGSAPGLLPTVTKITSADPLTQKGHEFPVAGRVQTDTGTAADGVLVEILINDTKDAEGAVLIGKGMAADGRFKIRAVIPGDMEVGEYHVLAHSLESARYGESWSDPVVKVVSGTDIDMEFSPRIKTGETLSLTGSLAGESGEPLSEQELEIYIDNDFIDRVVTDSAGRFAWENNFNEASDYTLKFNFSGSEYYLASSQEAELLVLSPAIIELKADGEIIGKPVSVSGRLAEEATGDPLPGRTLSASIDGVLKDITLVTDDNGGFKFKHTFSETGGHRIEVRLEGDADYYDVSSAVDITIFLSTPFSPWKTVIIAIAAVAVAGIWLLYRRLKNTSPRPAVADDKTMAVNQAIGSTSWKSSGSGPQLAIEFPQITGPFPDVWSTRDEMAIVLHLTDESGDGPEGPVDISINGEVITHTSTGKDGRLEIHHVFPSKGLYEITAGNEAGPDLKKATAGRTVRIVDYREEIVDLFDKLVAGFRKAGITIPEEATPRKIQYLVQNASRDIPEKALEDAVNCFEETDYSLHPITRRHYEIMYMAQKEIKEHGVRPAAGV